jgi:hypothetical protein
MTTLGASTKQYIVQRVAGQGERSLSPSQLRRLPPPAPGHGGKPLRHRHSLPSARGLSESNGWKRF